MTPPDPAAIVSEALSQGRTSLGEAEGKALLSAFGVRVPRSAVAHAAADAETLAASMQAPLVAKVVSPEILHKSDAGGVALHLSTPGEVRTAVERMSALPEIASARVEGWLVEEMIPAGREMVIGGVRDPQFGPMIMVGLGGIFVEVMKDVSFRLCPITRHDAEAMLAELKGAPLLDGVRGQAPADKAALVDIMLKLGGEDGLLMRFAGEISEMDVNPVIVGETGAVAADARFLLSKSEATPAAGRAGGSGLSLETFRPLFEPRTVAVLGASTRDVAIANTFIRRMKEFGYQGEIYPIHPQADEIEGLKAYPSLADTPEPVDYAYVAVGAQRIPDALGQANGRCRIAQVISSGFGEVQEGRELQEDLVRKARQAGVRVLGPNCLGTYSPRGGLTFPSNAPKETGTIGVVSQSGGLSTDIIKRGQWRGIRFSGLVTIGNSADVEPHELLDYYLEDPQTKAVGLYLEDVKSGRAFFDLLRSRKATKPVVILKGGLSNLGRAAAASHTGALAGDDRSWRALATQTPVALVETVDEFIDALLALQHLSLRPEKPTKSVTLFGNGGGSSVLGTDIFAKYGLDVSPLDGEARRLLEAMGLPPGTSVANPIDTPVRTLQEKDGWVAGEILDIVYEHARPDAVAMHLNLAAFVGRGTVDPVGNLFAVVEETQRKWPGIAHFCLALRTDGSPELDDKRREYREKARAVGVPVYDEIPAMARALAAVGHLERRLARTGR
ncbi:acetate--CoA ligase family protein [Lutibaculum baratangense]|uniref:Putative Acetyl-CoA synthetase (ADP-forming) alpha and beta chains n=1 Tax=Lutibaculum baratangense AMV1 TaxID=631454 RepID=V4RHP3_9HYPH|nr:acetate--CoA ligase family protein [Lutibaculum baratangense]ESR25646.1 putative Acetyl-CoA synthetase (ADP-forming) alpha and beta chains [Lutibaculum baratangense AMV1]